MTTALWRYWQDGVHFSAWVLRWSIRTTGRRVRVNEEFAGEPARLLPRPDEWGNPRSAARCRVAARRMKRVRNWSDASKLRPEALVRHGGNHDWYTNPRTGMFRSPVPRHRDAT